MSALTVEGAEVHLRIETNALRFAQIEREKNLIRIVFQNELEAEEVESTLLTAGGLHRPAVLPPLQSVKSRPT